MYANYVQQQRKAQRGSVLGFIFAAFFFLCFVLGVIWGKIPHDKLSPTWQWICLLTWSGLFVDGMLWMYVRNLGWPVVRLEHLLILFIQSAVVGGLCVQAQLIKIDPSHPGSTWFKLAFMQACYFLTSVLIVHAGIGQRENPSRARRIAMLFAAPPAACTAAACFASWFFGSGGMVFFIMGFPACGMAGLLVMSFCEMLLAFGTEQRPRARRLKHEAAPSSKGQASFIK